MHEQKLTKIVYNVCKYVDDEWEVMPWSNSKYIDDIHSSMRFYRDREPLEHFRIFKITYTYGLISKTTEQL